MDFKDIKGLLTLLRGSDVAEFEWEQDGVVLRIKRAMPGGSPQAMVASPAVPHGAPLPLPPAFPVIDSPPPVPGPSVAPLPDPPPPSVGYVVKSPFIGTFYRAPGPGAPPFVEVGSVVSKGKVVCIIEAMKVMNEIDTEEGGRVEKILVENGQVVQFDTPLFLIVPD